MYTDFRVCSFKVDDIAAAKSIYRITREEYNELFRNPNLSSDDILELEKLKKEIEGLTFDLDERANTLIGESRFLKDLNLIDSRSVIKLCEEFQSNFRWSLNNQQRYIASILNGRALSSIILGDVEALMKSVKEGTPEKTNHPSYKFYKKLWDLGYKFIVIDGNNRTTTIDYFRQDKVPLLESDNYQYQHPLFKSIKKSAKLYSQLTKAQKAHFNDSTLGVTMVTSGTLEDLGQCFVNVNSQVKLNDQEMRQANVCDFGYKVRELAKKHEATLLEVKKAKVDGKMKVIESALFTKKSMGRRNHEALIVKISNLVTNGTAKIDPDSLDACYLASHQIADESFPKVKKIFEQIMDYIKKCGRSFLDANGITDGNIIDLIMLQDYYNENNFEVRDKKKFTIWFNQTQMDKNYHLIEKYPEFQKTSHICEKLIDDETGEAVIKHYQDEDGNITGDIPHNTVFMDNLGKAFKYHEIQANLQANWLALRKQMLIASLRYMPDGVVVHKDNNRIFSPKLRYILYQRQGGKTFSTNETIELVDLYNSNKYQIDHVIDYADGGQTIPDNARLETRGYNQSGKYKKSKFASAEPYIKKNKVVVS